MAMWTEKLTPSRYGRLSKEEKLDLEIWIENSPRLGRALPERTQIARQIWLRDYYQILSLAAGRQAVLLQETIEHERIKDNDARQQGHSPGQADSHAGARAA